MLLDILDMLLGTIASLLGSALLLRVYLGWLRVSRSNPVAVFCVALTDWLVMPLRRVLPLRGRLDGASLAGAFLVALLLEVLMRLLRYGANQAWFLLAPAALLVLLHWTLYLLVALVVVNVLFSLINPHAPLAPTFDLLTRPVLAPLRRLIPAVGGFDLSPLVLFVILQALLQILKQVAF